MKIIKIMNMMLVLALTANSFVSQATTSNVYDENVIGKVSNDQGIFTTRTQVYGESKNDVGFLINHDAYEKEGVDTQTIFYSISNGKLKKEKYNVAGEYISDYDCITNKGKLTYLCQHKGRGKKTKAIISVYKNNKAISKKKISLKSLVTKNVQKKNYQFSLNRIYALSKNKVRVLYSVNKYLNEPVCYYGGVVDINLKTGKMKKGVKVKFVPESLEGGYICGISSSKRNLGLGDMELPTDVKYVMAKASSGKTVKSVSVNYGLEQSKLITKTNEVSGSSYKTYTGLPKGETVESFLNSHDFQGSKLIFSNASGIYYVSAKSNTIEKLMDYSAMPVYKGDENQKYLYRLLLKDKSEFYAIYTDLVDRESAKYTLVQYKRK